MKELYAGYDKAVLMLSDVLETPNCELEDLIGEAVLLPVISEIAGRSISLTAADRASPLLVDQIKAAADRLGVGLPEGWKVEIARRVAARWANDPTVVPTDVLDRAAKLFTTVNLRFSEFDTRAAASD